MISRKFLGLVIVVGVLLPGLLFGFAGRAEAAPIPVTEAGLGVTSAWMDARLPEPMSRSRVQTEPALALPATTPPLLPLLQGSPVLTITKTADPDPAVAGSSLVYTIQVTGDPISNVTGVVISDVLDSNVTFGSASDVFTPTGGIITWEPFDLDAELTATRTVTVTVNQVVSGTVLSNTAAVTSTEGGNDSTTLQTTVQARADLKISKTNHQTSLVPGVATWYTIIVTNTGPSVVTGATVTDNFPLISSVSWGCTPYGGAICPNSSGTGNLNETVDLPVGGSLSYVAGGTVDPTATGTLANTASVAAPADVSDPISDNSATDSDPLTPQADLKISKTNGQTSLVPGQVTTYTIIITNAGPSAVSGATLIDDFPSMSGVTWTCAGSGGASCPSGSGSGNLNQTVNLPPNGSLTYVASGTVDPWVTGSLTNTASITVPGGVTDPVADNSAVDTDTLTPRADLKISKTNGQTSLVPGEDTTYTIIVTNTGPSAVTGATLTDTFPSMSGVIWSCTPGGVASCPSGSGSGNLNQTINLPPGGKLTYQATGTVDSGARGTLVNTATVAVPAGVIDPVSDNSATDTDTLTPRADLKIAKTGTPNPVIAGNILTYDITIENDGPSNATSVTLADNLPSWVIFQAAIPSQGNCGGTISINCNLGTIVSGGTATATIRVTVDPSTPKDTVLINIANVLGVENDPIGGNNLTSTQNNVDINTDLAITKSDSADPVLLGNPLTYTLTITNNGPSNATGVVVTDTLPAAVSLVSVQSNRGSCPGTTPITCTLGAMTPGVTATITIRVDPLQTGLLSNQVSVSGAQQDPTSGNNSATETTQVNAQADLEVIVTNSPNPVLPGNNLTYNITIHNHGPSPAENVTLSDTLPAGVSLVSANASPSGSCSGSSTVTCNLGDLARDATVTVTIVVNVDESTSSNLANTVSVDSDTDDPESGNNSNTANAAVGEFKFVFLPLLMKAPPTLLSVKNLTSGPVTFTVIGTSVDNCSIDPGDTKFCGSFPPGTYNVYVTSICGPPKTFLYTYPSGPWTNEIFCK